MDRTSQLYFHEEQRIRQLGFRLAVLAAALPSWALLFGIVFEPIRTDGRALSAILFTWFTVGVVLPAFVTALKLTTEVRADGVYYCFSPIHLRFHRIGLEQMARFEALRYRPLLQYGGWGMRIRYRKRAYSISGDHGVQITLPDGRTVLFGSLKAESFADSITRARADSGLYPQPDLEARWPLAGGPAEPKGSTGVKR
jgi:hypothetical protein